MFVPKHCELNQRAAVSPPLASIILNMQQFAVPDQQFLDSDEYVLDKMQQVALPDHEFLDIDEDYSGGREALGHYDSASMMEVSQRVKNRKIITEFAQEMDTMESLEKEPIDAFWVDFRNGTWQRDGVGCCGTSTKPPMADDYTNGLVRFKIMRPRVWHNEVLMFAFNVGLEAIGLYTSGLLALALMTSDEYNVVPFTFRLGYVVSMLLAVVGGLAISISTARRHDQNDHLGKCKQSQTVMQRALLEWLSTPPNIMNTATRFVAHGEKQPTAKNWADPSGFRFPIINEGHGATIDFQNRQFFLSRLPKHLFSDVICFLMNIFMKIFYMDKMTTVMILQAMFSSLMLCKKAYECVAFCGSVRSFKGYLEYYKETSYASEQDKEKSRAGLRQVKEAMCGFA